MTSFRITFIFILMVLLIGSLTFGGQNANGKVVLDLYKAMPTNTVNSGTTLLDSIGPNINIYVKAYLKDVSNIVSYQIDLLIDSTKLSWVLFNPTNTGEKNILNPLGNPTGYTYIADSTGKEGNYKRIRIAGFFNNAPNVSNNDAPDGEGLAGLIQLKTKGTFKISDKANILVKQVKLADNSTPMVEEYGRATYVIAGFVNKTSTESNLNTPVEKTVASDSAAKVETEFVDGSKVSIQFITGTGLLGKTVTITSIGTRLTDALAADANKKAIEAKTAAFYNIETNITTAFTASLVVTFTNENLAAAGLTTADATKLVLAYFRTTDSKWARVPLTIIDTVNMTATAVVDHFSLWALVDSTDANVVPVELSTFSARLDNKDGVILEWTTVSETNNYGFYIERSKDNVNFVEIGFVKGNGNSTKELAYSYIDKDALEVGTYYYRLRQVDFDGSFAYSKPALVGIKAPDKYTLFSAYPNPFNPTTNIEFSLKEKGNVKLVVYNTLGQVVQTIIDNKELNAGKHRVVFNANNLASGMYIYKIQVNGFTDAKKVVYIK